MSIAPRIGVLALILIVASFPPTAQASGCVEVEYRSFGSGLHVVATTGRQLAFGLVTADPGEGLGAVVIITPALCGGVGLGSVDPMPLPGDDVLDGAHPVLDDALLLLPLP